jgi:hypothetical protein
MPRAYIVRAEQFRYCQLAEITSTFCLSTKTTFSSGIAETSDKTISTKHWQIICDNQDRSGYDEYVVKKTSVLEKKDLVAGKGEKQRRQGQRRNCITTGRTFIARRELLKHKDEKKIIIFVLKSIILWTKTYVFR